MPQREPQVRALPVATTSCICALALAPPCAHLSRPRRGRCAGPVAASLPEDDHGSTPTARERPTPKRSRRRYRDCGSNTRCAPARLLAHVWLHPSSQAFALLSSRHNASASRCRRLDGGYQLRRGQRAVLAFLAARRCDSHRAPRHKHHALPLALPSPRVALFRTSPLRFRACVFGCCCSFGRLTACGERATGLCAVPRRDREVRNRYEGC